MHDSAVKVNQDLRNDSFGNRSDLSNLVLSNIAAHNAPLYYFRTCKFPTSRYAPYTCEQVHDEMLALQRQGFVGLMTLGKKVGFCLPTDKLTSVLCGVATSYVFAEPIILREGKEFEYIPWYPYTRPLERVNYNDTDHTNALRRAVSDYNTFMAAHVVTARGVRYPTALRRVFNGRFTLGGRYYQTGPLRYQDLSGKGKPGRIPRRDLLINGHETIELDFATWHPTLLYTLEGEEPPEDVYSIPGYDRDAIKLAFNIALNAYSRDEALAALAETANLGSLQQAESYLSATTQYIPDLAKYLNSGEGIRLQNIDSNIATRIMAEFVEARVPVLVVHDSFIVQRQHTDMLRASMIRHFQEELQTSNVPRIK